MGLAPLSKNDPIDNLALTKLWISNCINNHVKCSENLTGFLPTRLLDVRAFEHEGSRDVKLVCLDPNDYIPDGGDVPIYATLSHCWGPPEKRPITTTKANFQERMARIHFEDLPTTFRDAARIIRELDYNLRYLWIDSLCIVQDDTEDWAREASLMADVYSQSFVTLAALSSSDSSQGCNIVDNIQEKVGTMIDIDLNNCGTSDTTQEPARIRVTQSKPQPWSWYYADYDYRFWGIKNPPLRGRAWALQERALSRRSIHFGDEQLLWECRELKATAQLPWLDETRSMVASANTPWLRSPSDLMAEEINPLATTIKHRWFELAEDYAARQLTQETDKLPALSGVSRSYQQCFAPGEEAVYVAGTWSSHLPDALLWETVPGDGDYAVRPSTYIAPTWSWTSVKTLIFYNSLRLGYVPFDPSDYASKPRTSNPAKPCHPANKVLANLKVKEMKGTPRYAPDPYGALLCSGTYLTLTGARIVNIDGLAPHPASAVAEYLNLDDSDLEVLKGGDLVGVLTPDVRSEVDRYVCQRSPRDDAGQNTASEASRKDVGAIEDLVCLALLGEPENTGRHLSWMYPDIRGNCNELVMGLLLRRLEGAEYERVGLVRWMRLEMFRGVEEVEVKLV